MKKPRLAVMPAIRRLIASFILVLSSAAFAAEPDAVIASTDPLIDALEAFKLIDDVAVSPAYILGYSLQLNAADAQSDSAAADVIYKMVTATCRESADAPASALGDSPTVTGTITNLSRADFAGKVLELKAGGFSTTPKDDVFATSSVANDGSFALRLPGGAEMTSLLDDATPELFGDPGCDTTVSPEVFKLANAPNFLLYVDGQLADDVLQTRGTSLNSTIVAYYYVDQNVMVTGTCAGGDFAGLETDIDMRKGWNTVVLDLTALTYRNEDLRKGYRWVIPNLCEGNFECSAD